MWNNGHMAVIRPGSVTLDQRPVRLSLAYRAGDSAGFTLAVTDDSTPPEPFDFTDWTVTGVFPLIEDSDDWLIVTADDDGIVAGITTAVSESLGVGAHQYAIEGVHTSGARRTFAHGYFCAERTRG